jgi:hypothetical protein
MMPVVEKASPEAEILYRTGIGFFIGRNFSQLEEIFPGTQENGLFLP